MTTLPNAPYPTRPGVVYRSGESRGICPRCHVSIVPTSRVVRLFQPDHPYATTDRRRSADTGKYYTGDSRPISLKPRWFVHERCYVKHYGRANLPHPDEGSKEWYEHRKAAVDELLKSSFAANLGVPPRSMVHRVIFASDEDLARSCNGYEYEWYAEQGEFVGDLDDDKGGLSGSAVSALLAEFRSEAG